MPNIVYLQFSKQLLKKRIMQIALYKYIKHDTQFASHGHLIQSTQCSQLLYTSLLMYIFTHIYIYTHTQGFYLELADSENHLLL